jgi:hypothetical protein
MEGAKILSEEEEKNVFVNEREAKKNPRKKYCSYYEGVHYVVSHSPLLLPALCCLCGGFRCSHQHPVAKHVQQHNICRHPALG